MAKDFAQWPAENERPFLMSDTIFESVAAQRAAARAAGLPVDDLRSRNCRRTGQASLILHGDNDASAPLPLTEVKTPKLIKGSKLVVYDSLRRNAGKPPRAGSSARRDLSHIVRACTSGRFVLAIAAGSVLRSLIPNKPLMACADPSVRSGQERL